MARYQKFKVFPRSSFKWGDESKGPFVANFQEKPWIIGEHFEPSIPSVEFLIGFRIIKCDRLWEKGPIHADITIELQLKMLAKATSK